MLRHERHKRTALENQCCNKGTGNECESGPEKRGGFTVQHSFFDSDG
jgi:hypothetical protein